MDVDNENSMLKSDPSESVPASRSNSEESFDNNEAATCAPETNVPPKVEHS